MDFGMVFSARIFSCYFAFPHILSLFMKSNSTPLLPHFGQSQIFRLLTLLLLVLGLQTGKVSAQQVLIDPNAEGGFHLGDHSFETNGWSYVNKDAANFWVTSWTSPTVSGAFIKNGGTLNSYNIGASSVVHFWRDVTIPANVPYMDLTFDWIGGGESLWDELLVSISPTTYTPVPSGAQNLATNLLTAPAITLGRYSEPFAPGLNHNQSLRIYRSDIGGNCGVETTFRLIFTWKNDDLFGTPPPVSVSKIRLVTVPLTITDPADQSECTTGTDFTFVGTPIAVAPSTASFTLSPTPDPAPPTELINTGPGTATLDVSATPPGYYNVSYVYKRNNYTCSVKGDTVRILEGPETLAPPKQVHYHH